MVLKNSKAQTAIEYLLIVVAAIFIASIAIIFVMNTSGETIDEGKDNVSEYMCVVVQSDSAECKEYRCELDPFNNWEDCSSAVCKNNLIDIEYEGDVLACGDLSTDLIWAFSRHSGALTGNSCKVWCENTNPNDSCVSDGLCVTGYNWRLPKVSEFDTIIEMNGYGGSGSTPLCKMDYWWGGSAEGSRMWTAGVELDGCLIARHYTFDETPGSNCPGSGEARNCICVSDAY